MRFALALIAGLLFAGLPLGAVAHTGDPACYLYDAEGKCLDDASPETGQYPGAGDDACGPGGGTVGEGPDLPTKPARSPGQ